MRHTTEDTLNSLHTEATDPLGFSEGKEDVGNVESSEVTKEKLMPHFSNQ